MNNTKPGSVGGVGKPRDQPVAQKRFTYVSRGKRRQGDGELSLVRELYEACWREKTKCSVGTPGKKLWLC